MQTIVFLSGRIFSTDLKHGNWAINTIHKFKTNNKKRCAQFIVTFKSPFCEIKFSAENSVVYDILINRLLSVMMIFHVTMVTQISV